MKKIFLVLLAFVLMLGLYLALKNYATTQPVSYTIEGRTLRLFEARTPQEWERGLMYKRQLPVGQGMIFLFPDKQIRTFWNKNTYMNLDILWMDNQKVVGRSFLPSIEKGMVTLTSPAAVNKVVELIK